ncbi:hypothetical protein QP028_00170 [Corynebacterium suedekumii]|nr:hypothetical protein QP028_00170 [Corynebacterium suedekumii]
MNRPTIAALAAVSTLFLTACSTDSSDTADSGASSADTVTVTESPTDSPAQQPTTVTEIAQATVPEDPGATGIEDEVNPAPYASNLIFPEQPGLQFTGPDGTFCEMYGSLARASTARRRCAPTRARATRTPCPSARAPRRRRTTSTASSWRTRTPRRCRPVRVWPTAR